MMERKRENMDIDPYTEALGKLEQSLKNAIQEAENLDFLDKQKVFKAYDDLLLSLGMEPDVSQLWQELNQEINNGQ
jgi:hypothetical protein